MLYTPSTPETASKGGWLYEEGSAYNMPTLRSPHLDPPCYLWKYLVTKHRYIGYLGKQSMCEVTIVRLIFWPSEATNHMLSYPLLVLHLSSFPSIYPQVFGLVDDPTQNMHAQKHDNSFQTDRWTLLQLQWRKSCCLFVWGCEGFVGSNTLGRPHYQLPFLGLWPCMHCPHRKQLGLKFTTNSLQTSAQQDAKFTSSFALQRFLVDFSNADGLLENRFWAFGPK